MLDVLQAHHPGSGSSNGGGRPKDDTTMDSPRPSPSDGASKRRSGDTPRRRQPPSASPRDVTLLAGIEWLEHCSGGLDAAAQSQLKKAVAGFKHSHGDLFENKQRHASGPARKEETSSNNEQVEKTLKEGIAFLEDSVGPTSPELKRALADFKRSHGDLFDVPTQSEKGKRALARRPRLTRGESTPGEARATPAGIEGTRGNGSKPPRSSSAQPRGQSRRSQSVDPDARSSRLERELSTLDRSRRSRGWRRASVDHGASCSGALPLDRGLSDVSGRSGGSNTGSHGDSNTGSNAGSSSGDGSHEALQRCLARQGALQRRQRLRQSKVEQINQQRRGSGREGSRAASLPSPGAHSPGWTVREVPSPRSTKTTMRGYDRNSGMSKSFGDLGSHSLPSPGAHSPGWTVMEAPSPRRNGGRMSQSFGDLGSHPPRRRRRSSQDQSVSWKDRFAKSYDEVPRRASSSSRGRNLASSCDDIHSRGRRASLPPLEREGGSRRRGSHKDGRRRRSDFARSCDDFSAGAQPMPARQATQGGHDTHMFRSFNDLRADLPPPPMGLDDVLSSSRFAEAPVRQEVHWAENPPADRPANGGQAYYDKRMFRSFNDLHADSPPSRFAEAKTGCANAHQGAGAFVPLVFSQFAPPPGPSPRSRKDALDRIQAMAGEITPVQEAVASSPNNDIDSMWAQRGAEIDGLVRERAKGLPVESTGGAPTEAIDRTEEEVSGITWMHEDNSGWAKGSPRAAVEEDNVLTQEEVSGITWMHGEGASVLASMHADGRVPNSEPVTADACMSPTQEANIESAGSNLCEPGTGTSGRVQAALQVAEDILHRRASAPDAEDGDKKKEGKKSSARVEEALRAAEGIIRRFPRRSSGGESQNSGSGPGEEKAGASQRVEEAVKVAEGMLHRTERVEEAVKAAAGRLHRMAGVPQTRRRSCDTEEEGEARPRVEEALVAAGVHPKGLPSRAELADESDERGADGAPSPMVDGTTPSPAVVEVDEIETRLKQKAQVGFSNEESPFRKNPPPPPPRRHVRKKNDACHRVEAAESEKDAKDERPIMEKLPTAADSVVAPVPSTDKHSDDSHEKQSTRAQRYDELVSANILSKEAAAMLKKRAGRDTWVVNISRQTETTAPPGGLEEPKQNVPPSPDSTNKPSHKSLPKRSKTLAVKAKLPPVVPPETIEFTCEAPPSPRKGKKYWSASADPPPPPPRPPKRASSQSDASSSHEGADQSANLNGTEVKERPKDRTPADEEAPRVPGPPPRQRSDSIGGANAENPAGASKEPPIASPRSKAKPKTKPGFALSVPPPPPPRSK